MIWNVIDRRENRHRWAKVHAIIEATWHDNAVSGADQAPEVATEIDVVYGERRDINVNEAINWANAQSCPVTLYLRDGERTQGPPNSEVDAACRILDGFGRGSGWWSSSTPYFDDLDAARKTDFRFIVDGMLRAAEKVRSENSA